MPADYRERTDDKLWWCNSHGRQATYIMTTGDGKEHPVCNPKLGGITIPCRCAELTNIVEVHNDVHN